MAYVGLCDGCLRLARQLGVPRRFGGCEAAAKPFTAAEYVAQLAVETRQVRTRLRFGWQHFLAM